MLGCDIKNIAHAPAWNRNPGGIQRLGIHLPIGAQNPQQAKIRRVDIRQRQDFLVQILARAPNVVAACQHVGALRQRLWQPPRRKQPKQRKKNNEGKFVSDCRRTVLSHNTMK